MVSCLTFVTNMPRWVALFHSCLTAFYDFSFKKPPIKFTLGIIIPLLIFLCPVCISLLSFHSFTAFLFWPKLWLMELCFTYRKWIFSKNEVLYNISFSDFCNLLQIMLCICDNFQHSFFLFCWICFLSMKNGRHLQIFIIPQSVLFLALILGIMGTAFYFPLED